jgi:hypothetical protein
MITLNPIPGILYLLKVTITLTLYLEFYKNSRYRVRVIVTFNKYKIPGIGLELSSLSANIKFQV